MRSVQKAERQFKENLFEAEAQEYHRHGLAVVPVKGKIAACPWKPYQSQAQSEDTIRAIFSAPHNGIAVIHGMASGGLSNRDFDNEPAYQRWKEKHPELAARLPTARTRRGYHVYHRSKHERFQKFADGEYRGSSGSYSVLPPSHFQGGKYEWIIPLSGDVPTLDPEQAGLIGLRTQVTQATQATQAPQATQDTHTHGMCKQGNEPTPVEMAIASTLPNGPGQRNSRIFELARRLKAVMPDAKIHDLKPIVRQWYDLALTVIRTQDWSITWADFLHAWRNVRHAVGGHWSEIAAIADTIPVDTLDHDGPGVRLIRLCAALQQHHGGNAWPLSCRKAGEEIGVSHVVAAKLLKMLVMEEVLELVTPAGPKGSERAAEYRFIGQGGAI